MRLDYHHFVFLLLSLASLQVYAQQPPKVLPMPPTLQPTAPATPKLEVPADLPNLSDEEPGGSTQTDKSKAEEDVVYTPPPETRSEAYLKIPFPEDISALTSPYQTNVLNPQFVSLGRSKRMVDVLVFDRNKSKLFFNLAPVKDGYLLSPMGYNAKDRVMVYEVLPFNTPDTWMTVSSRRRPVGGNVFIALLNLTSQNWRFIELPAYGWLSKLNLFWGVDLKAKHHFLIRSDGVEKRYVAPLQRGKESAEVLQLFSFNKGSAVVLNWIDYCTNQRSQKLCLWESLPPFPEPQIPFQESVLPLDHGSTRALWKLEKKRNVMILTYMAEGGAIPVRRWWKTESQEKWRPLYQNKFSDPRANTVLISEGSRQLAVYALKSVDGINAELIKIVIDTGTRKTKTFNPRLPWKFSIKSDLFETNPGHILVFSEDGLVEVDVSQVFSG